MTHEFLFVADGMYGQLYRRDAWLESKMEVQLKIIETINAKHRMDNVLL